MVTSILNPKPIFKLEAAIVGGGRHKANNRTGQVITTSFLIPERAIDYWLEHRLCFLNLQMRKMRDPKTDS
jgi:hypothetical protein